MELKQKQVVSLVEVESEVEEVEEEVEEEEEEEAVVVDVGGVEL